MTESQENKLAPTKEVILVREQHEDEDQISLSDYFLVLKKHWKLIVFPSLVIALAVGIYTFTRPRMYRAQTTIVPPIDMMQQQGGLASKLMGTGSSLLQGMLGGQGDMSDLYVGILESRSIAERIINRFKLKDVYEQEKMVNVFNMLDNRTDFKVQDDGIISIQVTDRDPKRAAEMANAFVEELDKENRRLSAGSITSKRKFLANRLSELKKELASIDQMPSNEAKIKEMIFEMLSQQYELAKVEEAKSMPTIQVLDTAVPPEIGVARGTIKKGILAGITTFFLGMFIAFSREYFTVTRSRM